MILLGKIKIDKMPILVIQVSEYDILISMENDTRLGTVISCRKYSIYFSKYKVRVICDRKSRESKLAITEYQEVPDFLTRFTKVLAKDVAENYSQWIK